MWSLEENQTVFGSVVGPTSGARIRPWMEKTVHGETEKPAVDAEDEASRCRNGV